ncbi:MAG: D-glycero-alpha-D-manno-heptose-1,7-bisphosphate 7-phosphatase [Terriglobia bacterium]
MMRQFARPPKIILLDRDGVINRRIPGGYVTMRDEFVFLPGVLGALKRLADEGLKVIVVSNQAGVGKGLLEKAALAEITEQLVRPVEENGGKIHGVYYCPHRPDDGCECRKPGPGLLLQAQREHGFDFRETLMIGDAESDVAAAHRAGCACILVGSDDHEAPRSWRHQPDWIFRDLPDAVRFILGERLERGEAKSAG